MTPILACTPPPWSWRCNPQHRVLDLVAPHSGALLRASLLRSA